MDKKLTEKLLKSSTIDNPEETLSLIQEIKQQLPIPAKIPRQLAKTFQEKGRSFKENQDVVIKSVLYSGDAGGIICDISERNQNEAVLCSITNLKIDPKHPLYKKINEYQTKRSINLSISKNNIRLPKKRKKKKR